MKQKMMLPLQIAGFALAFLLAGQVMAASLLGEGFEKFFKERVRFGGFVENTTGLSIGKGDRHFSTSNRFIMNRFTVQPEFNIDFARRVKLFVSWRFVKEPRYSAEAKSRRKSVAPASLNAPHDNTFYDEDSPKPWELVLDLIPNDQLQIRLGRQFISWGETDGVRLLDVINPQDSTFSPPGNPNLFNLDETRIPQWGVRVFYTLRAVSNTIFEFFANPGFDEAKQRVDEIVGSNDGRDQIVRYGRWSSHPETRLVLGGRSAFGNLLANPIPGNSSLVVPLVSRGLPDAGDNWKIGTRITHNIGALNFGIGYIWGFNPQSTDMVFKVSGARILLGAPSPFTPTGIPLRLINDRTSIFAGHFNYPLGTYFGIPVKTALRGEVAFYPSKPYNISKYPGSFGLKAGPHPRHPKGITEKNTLRYSLGFDRSTFIAFLHPDDPWRAFRMSFQIIQSVILDHEDGIRFFGTAEKIKKVSTFITFRVGTGYLGDTILPDIFLTYDPRGYWSVNPAVSYSPPWNERIKLTLTAAIYGGHNKFSGLGGLFSEKDSLFLKMRYQL
jgi:hypothetical protein